MLFGLILKIGLIDKASAVCNREVEPTLPLDDKYKVANIITQLTIEIISLECLGVLKL